jgi:hypothetical protein
MSLESTVRRQPHRERQIDAPRDKPRVERGEHANLERPGAQFHPVARGWQRSASRSAWPRGA